MIYRSENERQTLRYRCPQCHYLVDTWALFGIGCPICGWVSPLAYRQQPPPCSRTYIDVIYEEEVVRVTTELPVVNEGSIKLSIDNDTLMISAGSLDRIVPLRRAVGQVIEKTYKNGVLEIVLRKKGRCSYGGEKGPREKTYQKTG